jgi:transposase
MVSCREQNYLLIVQNVGKCRPHQADSFKVHQLRKFIEEKIGFYVSQSSISRILRKIGFTYRCNDRGKFFYGN